MVNIKKKKSKINRKYNKSTNKLKSQKGGDYELNYNNAITYLKDKNLNNIEQLIIKFFENKKKNFNMDISLNDPFINFANDNSNAYLDWYKSKNPKMKKMNELEKFDTLLDGVSIYETVMAQICRDILLMIITRKKNLNNEHRLTVEEINNKIEEINEKIKTNTERIEQSHKLINNPTYNKFKETLLKEKKRYAELLEANKNKKNEYEEMLTKIKSNKESFLKEQFEKYSKNVNDNLKDELDNLLKKINSCISNKYIYNVENGVYDVIISFIEIISKDDNKIKEFFMEKHLDTPFIVFPTYQQINFQNVILLMSAPIINFRISNRNRRVHDFFDSPSFDYIHDVCFHGNVTHLIQINLDNEKRKHWFDNMSLIISILFNSFVNKEKPSEKITINKNIDNILYTELTPKQQKQIMAFVLFCLLHEEEKHYLFYSYILEKSIPETVISLFINKIKRETSNNKFDYIFPEVNKLDIKSVSDSLLLLINENKQKLLDPVEKLKEIEKTNNKYKSVTGNERIDEILNRIEK